jgi:replicative DNA helicase Mcm
MSSKLESKAVDDVELDPQALFQELFKQKYRSKIAQLSVDGKKSFSVDFQDIYTFNQDLAKALLGKPEQFLEYARNAAYDQLQIEDEQYAETLEREDLVIRVNQLLQAEALRNLGAEELGKLVMVEAIIVRATPIKPMIIEAVFKCKKCGCTNRLIQNTPFIKQPFKCEAPDCGRSGPYLFELSMEDSTWVDSQDLRLQERPEDLPSGQMPRTIAVKLVGKEIVNLARPGDHTSIVGIPRAVAPLAPGPGKSTTFNLEIEANSIHVLGKEPEAAQPTPEEEQAIKELAKDPWIHRKVASSIAPSIYGYEHIKEAIMYLLFGGVTKHLPDITIRGELNTLIIGDPGTAKSQLLQYIPRICPRGLYTSGKGNSAAGLTAAVIRDKNGSMSLEAGALVLADKGVCCIDEIEKMKPEDRVAIHEAMEQHTISICKAGIVATLNARTSILAAGNPSLGRYEPYKNVTENINLPITILSRFDLIFIIRDTPEKVLDDKKASHILEIHRSRSSPIEPAISSEMLRKYISYAKTIQPIPNADAVKKLKEFYLQMRAISENDESPVAITARQLESLVRLSEAHARVALRKEVTGDDADAAINIMKRSLEEVGLDTSSMKMDIDLIMTGKPKSTRDKLNVILTMIIDMNNNNGSAPREEIIQELEAKHKFQRQESEHLIQQLLREGQLFEPREGMLKRT